MNLTVEKQDGKQGKIELTITVPVADQKKYLEKAAIRMTEAKPIKGFRPGKATFEVVEKTYGGDSILNEAVQDLIQSSLFDAIDQEDIKTVGQPKIDVVKQTYDNDFVYKATISLLPNVKAGDVSKIKVKPVKVELSDEEIAKAVDGLRKMRATESLVKRAAKMDDLVELDFSTKVNNVPIDGGDAKDYKLVLGDQQMIPGFEETLVGLKAGEDKTFKLKFPKEYKKDLAGKEAEFSVSMKNVFERNLPEIDDEFAKGFGQENADGLKKILADNLKQEKETEEFRRQEVEILKQLVGLSEFGPLPELLLDNEQTRMQHELEEDLSKNGLAFEQYLQNIDKTAEGLKEEMKPQAEMRVKTALITKTLADDQKIKANEAEIKEELKKLKVQYQANPEIMKTLESPDYAEYIGTILSNQKVIAWLKEQVLGEDKVHHKGVINSEGKESALGQKKDKEETKKENKEEK